MFYDSCSVIQWLFENCQLLYHWWPSLGLQLKMQQCKVNCAWQMSMKLFNTRTHAHTTHTLIKLPLPLLLSPVSHFRSMSILNINKTWVLLEKLQARGEDRSLLLGSCALRQTFQRGCENHKARSSECVEGLVSSRLLPHLEVKAQDFQVPVGFSKPPRFYLGTTSSRLTGP